MTEADVANAVADARALIARQTRGEWHTVAAVVVTAKGAQFIGINLDSVLPRASVCAEPVALGMAATADPDDAVLFCCAVNRRGEVIPPCGVCRELLLDYAGQAQIAVPGGDDYVLRPLAELVPDAYKADRRKS